jgi:hypothetical protein
MHNKYQPQQSTYNNLNASGTGGSSYTTTNYSNNSPYVGGGRQHQTLPENLAKTGLNNGYAGQLKDDQGQWCFFLFFSFTQNSDLKLDVEGF